MQDKKPEHHVSRREFIAATGAATGVAALIISGSAVMSSTEAWGMEVKNLKPETMATLIQVARDIYPHDRVADRYYAVACKSFDKADLKDDVETGITLLNSLAKASHNVDYKAVGWEAERVAILQKIEKSPMFQAIRGSLVVGLYNQKEVWPIFGYQGASYEHGGYKNRGFDDIDWL